MYSILFIAIGLFAILGTFLKLNFYWNSRKAMRLRGLIGDLGASIVYYIIGGFLLLIGLSGLLGFIQY